MIGGVIVVEIGLESPSLPRYAEQIDPRDLDRLRERFPDILRRHGADGGVLIGDDFRVVLNRGVRLYEGCLDVNVENIVRDRVASSRDTLYVADIGCGTGKFLRELKDEYKGRICVVGFDLARTKSHDSLDHFVEMDFETEQVPKSLRNGFDLIFSCQTFRYFRDGFGTPYRNVRGMLKTNSGLAFVDYEDVYSGKRSDPLNGIRYIDSGGRLVVNSGGCMRIRSDSPDDPIRYLRENGAYDK